MPISARTIILLIFTQVLLSLFCLQDARTQVVTNDEIANLEKRVKEMTSGLVSTDAELAKLQQGINASTTEINRLKKELREEESKPKSLFGRIAGIFSRKKSKLEGLMTRSQDLADRINDLQRNRDTRIKFFVLLADELIDKAGLRIGSLMKVVRTNNLAGRIEARDEALKQMSDLWLLTEETTSARNKYAPETLAPEREIDFTSLISNDPEELRLSAAILKDKAAAARNDAAELGKKIEELQRKKRLLEQGLEMSKEIQRSDEEVPTIAFAPWGSDIGTKREISETDERIEEYSDQMGKIEVNAEKFENQSRTLELRASQIEAELKGKSENG